MTLPEFRLRYKDCTNDELRQFVRQRRGNLRRESNRKYCIKTLKQLDREVTFRFFDMAPELRNRVYELLLNHNNEQTMISRFTGDQGISNYTPPQASKAYPALLRVSHKVYNEACGILYDQSALSINIVDGVSSRTRLFGVTHTPGPPKSSSLVICHPHLLRIKHLTMTVSVWEPKLFELSMRILPLLLRHFGTRNPVKSLKLVCSPRSLASPNLDPDHIIALHFLELRHLPATAPLELVGFTAPLEEEIRAAIERPAK
ncbi:hypothetical protein M409DRAFT_16308 [Zasmidium cellare ATCC 36951]|uniref:Uncharacterized protein n=1 Tax=Zasmidium cellare ATCC 36951 TaxID=1080233 RepID=A0A6A6D4H8_ZASCE|nr:uncharacterized protein M409DRAFT_16308 [Zasmidium cellare ATCC 36951]KAF2174033.1 hypothetical protein M409DRAFT_16308 [Zasmidium cellare ATCC 36951]